MSIKDRLKQNLAVTWLSHVVALAIGLYLMPFVLTTLGDGTYGTWIFLNSIAGYSGLLYLGMGEMISRYVSTQHAKQDWKGLNESVAVVFYTYLVMGSVCGLLGFLFAIIGPMVYDFGSVSVFEVRVTIAVIGLNVALGLLGCAFGGVVIGVQRYDLVKWSGLIAALVRLGLTVAFLQQQWGLLILAGIMFAVTLIENAIPVFLAFRLVPTLSIRPRHFRRSRFRESFGFSIFVLLENAAFQLIYATDTVVIGILLGAKAIVPYFVASRLCGFIQKPVHQIGLVSMPQAGALHASGDDARLRHLVKRSTLLSVGLTAGTFIGACYFGSQVITTWVGEGYAISTPILLILLAIHIVALPVGVFRSILMGMGLVRLPCSMYFLEAVLNLFLTLIFIHYWGLIGVAIGTAIPLLIIELGVVLPYTAKKLGYPVSEMAKEILLPLGLPLASLWAYAEILSGLLPGVTGWPILLAIAAGGAGVLAGAWFVQTWIAEQIFRPNSTPPRPLSTATLTASTPEASP